MLSGAGEIRSGSKIVVKTAERVVAGKIPGLASFT